MKDTPLKPEEKATKMGKSSSPEPPSAGREQLISRSVQLALVATLLLIGISLLGEPRNWAVPLLSASLLAILTSAVLINWLARRLRLERGLTTRTSRSLQESEARLGGIVDSAMDAIITTDESRRIILFNRAAEEMFGISSNEVMGTLIDRFIPNRFRAAHATHMRRFGETGITMRNMHRTAGALPALKADGTEFLIEATISQSNPGDRKLYTAMIRDVTERVQAEKERESLIQDLAAASQAKSDFLARMSHELRTPLNAVAGYVDLLDLGIQGKLNEGQLEYLSRIRVSGQHLLRLINDILDLSRLEAGGMQVHSTIESLPDAVRTSVDIVAPQAAAKNVEIKNDSDCYPIRYRGDPDRTRQILVSLLSNAVKFTPPGGMIYLRSEVKAELDFEEESSWEGPWVGVTVEDNGLGIAEEDLEKIFQPFTQLESPYTRSQGGTGLGLTISRELARRMDGYLSVESASERGSSFTLWLPAIQVERVPDLSETSWSWPSSAGEVAGLCELGTLISREAQQLSVRIGDRMQADEKLGVARGLDRSQLEDHFATILTGIGKEIFALDEGKGEPAMMRDGTDIQRFISERHGQQRARLGWNATHLAREREHVNAEVNELLSRVALTSGNPTPPSARDILQRLLDRAYQISLSTLQSYQAVRDSDPKQVSTTF